MRELFGCPGCLHPFPILEEIVGEEETQIINGCSNGEIFSVAKDTMEKTKCDGTPIKFRFSFGCPSSELEPGGWRRGLHLG
jgi:hypothetical protein